MTAAQPAPSVKQQAAEVVGRAAAAELARAGLLRGDDEPEGTVVIDYAAWSERDQDFKMMERGWSDRSDAETRGHARTLLDMCLHDERGPHPWRLRDRLYSRQRTIYAEHTTEWTEVTP